MRMEHQEETPFDYYYSILNLNRLARLGGTDQHS